MNGSEWKTLRFLWPTTHLKWFICYILYTLLYALCYMFKYTTLFTLFHTRKYTAIYAVL